jgi:MEMO1 family protein
MRTISVILFSIICIMETFSQNKSNDRQPYAAGRFYSDDKKTLASDISRFFQSCPRTPASWNVRAIISPHAGYVFSGKIAAEAFHSIPENTVYKNIFVIGSSHTMAFDGASVFGSGDYITPLGKVTVNREIAAKLTSDNKVFNYPEKAHLQEHSLEVQMPFIQSYFKNTPGIVPIVIGTQNESTVRKIADALRPYFTKDNLFIVSSDFSHYPSYADAERTDSITSLGISSGSPQTFLNTIRKNSDEGVPGLLTSMCGWTSGLALLYLIDGNKNLEVRHIDYCNSGDSPYGNKNEVVGYHAFAVIDKHDTTERSDRETSDISFTSAEKNQLFRIAESSIRTKLYENKKILLDEKDMTPGLQRQLGAFVTLKVDGALRGCIGRFISTDPLYSVVQASALSSAFEDPRFPPLTKEEFEKTEIEITVLGPLKRINDIKEIVLGKHGIYIKKDYRSGTMLPQVATENKWTVEEFLGYTSRDKAGIGWTGWKDAELYIYEGVVLRR